MIILHKAQRIDNNEEVIGFITNLWGQYHIILENDENKAYPVITESIRPYFDEDKTYESGQRLIILDVCRSTAKGIVGEELKTYLLEKYKHLEN